MASLLPLIQDILPMILPSSIHITKASEVNPPSAPAERARTEGSDDATVTAVGPRVIHKNAVVNKTDKICASGKSPLSKPHNAQAAEDERFRCFMSCIACTSWVQS
jgi:hypothetical protein